MPFDTLPEFPQGREVTSMSSVAGIPPEKFQQALRDSGTDLIESTKRPEDFPVVNAALENQVEDLAQQMGLQQPQAAQQAPDPPETQAAPYQSPEPADPFQERILRVMEKYSSPQEMAKAYLHTDQARTRAQQDRAEEIRQLREELDQIKQRPVYQPQAYAPPVQQPVYQQPQQPVADVPEDAEEFFRKPKENLGRVIRDAVKSEIDRYSQDQRAQQEEQWFEQKRQARSKEIEALKPIMNEIYMKDQDLYEGIPKDRALDLLLERANERFEAQRGRAFFQEMQQTLGGNGTPAAPAAAPGTTGALPSAGTGNRRPGSRQAVTDWSNTPNFNRLWKTRSESYDEHRSIMDILKERGFGEDVR